MVVNVHDGTLICCLNAAGTISQIVMHLLWAAILYGETISLCTTLANLHPI